LSSMTPYVITSTAFLYFSSTFQSSAAIQMTPTVVLTTPRVVSRAIPTDNIFPIPFNSPAMIVYNLFCNNVDCFFYSRLSREHSEVFFPRVRFGNCFDGDGWVSAMPGEMKVYLICILYHFVWVVFHRLKLVYERNCRPCLNYNIKNNIVFPL